MQSIAKISTEGAARVDGHGLQLLKLQLQHPFTSLAETLMSVLGVFEELMNGVVDVRRDVLVDRALGQSLLLLLFVLFTQCTFGSQPPLVIVVEVGNTLSTCQFVRQFPGPCRQAGREAIDLRQGLLAFLSSCFAFLLEFSLLAVQLGGNDLNLRHLSLPGWAILQTDHEFLLFHLLPFLFHQLVAFLVHLPMHVVQPQPDL
mmetsp:Transcript_44175/g.70199  ORF Transcript_44175/g.70199 Transcript_44175/m.70199 type:complete len:202 (-) Transcript_44175:724-1329(-)